jgi:hypothetical protein
MSYKIISSLCGKNIFVDSEDFPLLSRHSWTVSSEGYARTCCGNLYLYMHRLVMAPKGSLYIDHINNERLDNRKSNLREATNSQNQMNRKNKPTGVSFHKLSGKWRARITKNQKEIYLGLFSTEDEAIEVRNKTLKIWENL